MNASDDMSIARLSSLADDSLAPACGAGEMGASEHFVQFYDSDEFLVNSVSEFIGAGLGKGDRAIVIATKAHREQLETRLRMNGLDLTLLSARQQFIALDAAATLARFMAEGEPDPALFAEVVGKLVSKACEGHNTVRAFGEMVALLWAEGNSSAAIKLEELWNELGKTQQFSLFCAYPIAGFRGVSNAQPLLHICKAHSRVIPAESYAAQVSSDQRLRSIAMLQQKAGSLELEMAERQHAQAETLAEQTRLEMAASVAQLGIWEVDMATNLLTCSDRCKAHFGLAATESLDFERILGLIHPADRQEVETGWRRALADGRDYSSEFRVVVPSSGLRWISAMARCFHNGTHRMLGVTRDITDRKLAGEILERTVADRTVELQEIIGELEAFSYSISHDLRAPLRSIQGYARILIQECGEALDDECRSYLRRIQASGERMDRLIQDVLTLSRVARTDFKLEPVDLDMLAHGIIESYPNLQPPHAEVLIEGRLPIVLGNPAALTQCLSNLLGNAVKFVAPGGHPSVRVWAERAKLSPNSLNVRDVVRPTFRLFIQDNGIGIPKHAQDKIFGIFQRLSKDYDGTGIGLAIVKKAIERMGGRVGVHSEAGQGSTFWLDLQHATSTSTNEDNT
jgi:PAS domain S-box-containing protein